MGAFITSTGYQIESSFLQTAVPIPAFLAERADMDVDGFLDELEAWASSIGVRYGIDVDAWRAAACGGHPGPPLG